MLKIENIHKKYGKKPILNGISFQAELGECVGIIGSNGCGKTTMLSILAGVLQADAGEMWIDGKNVIGNRKYLAQKVAYVPQENPLIPELSALDNYRLWFNGNKKDMEYDLKHGVGKILDIEAFLKIPAGKLSGGQKKRLSIASALSNKAEILIMDEPGAALDLIAKQEIINFIKEHMSGGGMVIMTSHEIAELEVCTKLYIMKQGKLLEVNRHMAIDELIKQF